ncbi:T9SS type A sorting domain-containing protein [bacterium]|nr:T9SS type A sorting domain-containing protein [bacterium]
MKRPALYGAILFLIGSATGILSQPYLWVNIPSPSGSPITSVAINPDGHLFVGTIGADHNLIYKTEDNGANWAPSAWDYTQIWDYSIGPLYYPDIKQLLISQTGVIYAVAEGYSTGGIYGSYLSYYLQNGLFMSEDNGTTWDWVYRDFFGSPFDAALNSNGVIYVAPKYEVYYSNDHGDTWICNGPTCTDPNWETEIGYHEVNSTGQIFSFDWFLTTGGWKAESFTFPGECYGVNESGVYIGSIDGTYKSPGLDLTSGNTWTNIGPAGKHVRDLFMLDNGEIYAATNDGVWFTDDEATWTQLGPAGYSLREINMIDPNRIMIRTMGNLVYLGYSTYIHITYPDAPGLQLERLKEYNITWTSRNVGPDVRIELCLNNNPVKILAENTPDDGFFSWFVNRCHGLGSGYQIKITSIAKPDQFDIGEPFEIIHNTTIPDPKIHSAPKVCSGYAPPVIDGDLNDAIWNNADYVYLDVGGNVGDYNVPWTAVSDNWVGWKAVWSDATNKLYVAVSVLDDKLGTFDNGELDAVYSPSDDESIEIFTNGDCDCSYTWETFENAQYWRITGENHRNLLHFPTPGNHAYNGNDFKTAIKKGSAGNWDCEIAFTIYDLYDSKPKTLAAGDRIGWDVWYNDSDDQTFDTYFHIDHQVGWNYQGPVWKQTDYQGYLFFTDSCPAAVEEEKTLPEQHGMLQNFPNPFNPGTTISYELPGQTHVKLQIYDIQGRLIKTLVSEIQPEGAYSVMWDGSDHANARAGSGVYFCRLTTDNFTLERKLIVLK